MVDHSDTGLGKETVYNDQYDPSLLFPIPRAKARGSVSALAFVGVDLWTAFEISWLNHDGLPQLAIGEFIFPCTSESIVESKSFKLYLNSFIQTTFDSRQLVKETLIADLSAAVCAPVELVLYEIAEYNGFNPVSEPNGVCLDQQVVAIDQYQPDPSQLSVDKHVSEAEVSEILYSHLLKTNCPVTDQPDWASVYIEYRGAPINRAGLLKYIVSFRQHQDFHEQCVEKIFSDIVERCKPKELSVYARYMRRGGLDINPYRSTHQSRPPSYRQVRQ
ncbi:NADPH-dependent 7-cyano-7-deazaguanine reductase QueF [bacterium]|nr:NADPH-dependent 7-cyano-7-deazaguanine reductase QueF [Porticoccaceae bacterium]MDC3261893.1 NADPH-dependent 7-cyano-7-deazaguanine reductase QueF [bacterium]